jgi:uracil-DNA glycosylase
MLFPCLPDGGNHGSRIWNASWDARNVLSTAAMNADRADLRAILAFYVEAGVDAVLQEEPVDRFADEAQPAPVAAPPPAASAKPTRPFPLAGMSGANLSRPAAVPVQPVSDAPPSADAAIMAARELARTAASLDDLRALLDSFEGCGLRKTAKQLVFAAGNPQARVMFVGEAPGREEDLEGLPFVGRSGQLLDRMMAAIGLDRTSAYIANVVPWRPPGNRTPTPQETQTCLPFTLRQIELADPDILVCLGGPSAQTLLGIRDGIRKSRGRWHAFQTGRREIRAMPTFHPAYLLRTPIEKRFVWRDFLAIKKALAG